MVSERCKMSVQSTLERLGLNYSKVGLGEVEIMDNIQVGKLNQLDTDLKKNGFALIQEKKSILIEKIKIIIIELIHYSKEPLKINFSDYLSEKLNHDYTYLANIFSADQGITIEHFLIKHRIEQVKELLLYDELNITEIAYKMHYPNVAHLSSQFKKTTGLTPSEYKHLTFKNRRTLDKL
jgi:YesN/AraC family two-component response regulator